MRRTPILVMMAALIVCSPVSAQTSGTANLSPGMGATTPLGLQLGSAVQPTGIGLGATEMAAPGLSSVVSPSTSGPMPGNTACVGTTGSTPQASTALFDGGGITAAAPVACPGTGSDSTSTSTSSPLQAGRTNIPLGATELGNLGISSAASVPLPAVSSATPSTMPCPTTTTSLSSSPSMGSSTTASGC